jgi:hypothetical protein
LDLHFLLLANHLDFLLNTVLFLALFDIDVIQFLLNFIELVLLDFLLLLFLFDLSLLLFLLDIESF